MAKKTTSGGTNPWGNVFPSFDPAQMAQMFDPSKLMDQIKTMAPQVPGMDMSTVMERNKRNFDAVVEANQAAAATYRDMLDKQMEIFNRMTGAAQDYAGQVESPVSTEAMGKNAEATSKAVETALGLMREMAEAAQAANQKVFEEAQARMAAAIDEFKKG